jgi:hypothetical protein
LAVGGEFAREFAGRDVDAADLQVMDDEQAVGSTDADVVALRAAAN